MLGWLARPKKTTADCASDAEARDTRPEIAICPLRVSSAYLRVKTRLTDWALISVQRIIKLTKLELTLEQRNRLF